MEALTGLTTQASPLGSVVLHYKCNITVIKNTPPKKFVILINKMNHSRNTLERSVKITVGGLNRFYGFKYIYIFFSITVYVHDL